MNETKIINSMLVVLITLSVIMFSRTALYITGVARANVHQTTVAAFGA